MYHIDPKKSFRYLFDKLGRRMSLRAALVAYVLVPMTAASLFMGLWGLHAFERQVEKRMQYDLEMVARAIKRPLSHAIKRDREGSIAQTLESAFSVDQVYGAYVYDTKGEKISTTGSKEPDSGQEQVKKMEDDGRDYGEFGEVGGQDVYSYFVPLEDSGGRITGLLQLTRRTSDFQEQIRKARYKAAAIFMAAFLCLTGLVFYGHHRALGKYLNRLSGSMSKIAEGNRHHRYHCGGPREVNALGVHFNQMMDNINNAEMEIRQRRENERILEGRLRRAEKLAAIGQLAAGVAHELGTPLSVIEGKSQRALRNDRMPESAARDIKDIRFELRRMEQIIRQLLDFSRRSEIRRKRINAAQLAGSAVASLTHETERLGTRTILEGAAEDDFCADPLQMEQVLVNLIRNGIQAAGENGTIRISWKSNTTETVFRVEDSGRGITDEVKPKLFEPFFTTKPVGSGTGLGLAVVHGIVEEHGGTIDTEESELGGACFSLYIPEIAQDEDRSKDNGNDE
ncbi:MAG: HAMP domain-containing sensor histidine kinase [Desulfosalsimonadaceae bacterium]